MLFADEDDLIQFLKESAMKPKVVLEVSLTGAPPLLSIRGNSTGLAELSEALDRALNMRYKVTTKRLGSVVVSIERVD